MKQRKDYGTLLFAKGDYGGPRAVPLPIPDRMLRQSASIMAVCFAVCVLALAISMASLTSYILFGALHAGHIIAGAISSALVAVLCFGFSVAFERQRAAWQPRAPGAHTEARRFMDAILDALPIPTLVKDAEGRFVVVSERARAVLNRPLTDLIGRTDADISSPNVAALVGEEDRKLFESNTEYREEVRFETPDGRGRWYEKCKRAVTLADGSQYIIASTLDIHARKQAEEALRKSEAFLRTATWGADIRLWSWNPKEDSLELTDHLMRRLGYEPGELSSTWAALEGLVHPDDRAGFTSSRRDAIESGLETYESEFRLRQRDGQWAWILSRGRIERDQDGMAQAVIGVDVDITAIKLAQESLRQHRDELEGEVARRTEELLKARDLADRANRAKSEFLMNMSHELRTPLHSIMSFSHLGRRLIAKGEPLSEKLDRYFATIAESGIRLSDVFESLLELSTLVSDDDALSFVPNDVVAVARQVAVDMGRPASAKRIDLKFEPVCESLSVICDAPRISQFIRHLVSNAIKYSAAETQVTLRIGPAPSDERYGEGGAMWRIAVEDQGVGIPAAELLSVFDTFVQGSKTRTGAGGTGIGLTICKHVVRLHGGRIWAEANPDQGTTFVAVLPVSGGGRGASGAANGTDVTTFEGAIPAATMGADVRLS